MSENNNGATGLLSENARSSVVVSEVGVSSSKSDMDDVEKLTTAKPYDRDAQFSRFDPVGSSRKHTYDDKNHSRPPTRLT